MRSKKDVLTYRHYADMEYDELLGALKEKFRQAQRISLWFNELEKAGVLVMLQALHDKVAQPGRRRDLAGPDPESPTWADVCGILGITPNLVRVWRSRTQANLDIRHLLGEPVPEPGKKVEDTVSELRASLRRICTAVVYSDKEEEAEQLAMALIERYG